jgi:primosomal protein N' (replication factor Y)
MNTVFRVCIPNTMRDGFDYHGHGLAPQVGSRVLVPFRNQTKLGIVTAINQESSAKVPLKNIASVIDECPLLDTALLKLCAWVSGYYQSPLSEVLPLAIPKKYRLGEPCTLPVADYFQLQMTLPEAFANIPANAHKLQSLLSLFNEQPLISKKQLQEQGFISTHWNRLIDKGILALQQKPLAYKTTATPKEGLVINQEQTEAFTAIADKLSSYGCFLLQGVTGSGKTEVYLQLIAKVLAAHQQALVLVPEIGLTPQLVERFRERFCVPISVIHSGLNESERQIAWQLAKENKAPIVIGTRSSVFTPMPALGIIIIDEEHDGSFKQMEGVRYSARDTALMRAHFANIPIVLGSATPSLESMHNCTQNKYTLLRLTQKAESQDPLHYTLIDMRAKKINNGLCQESIKTIQQHLNKNNQVLVFINRRGYAPVVLCHQCGFMADCKACDSHLTLHKSKEQMICHHCGLYQKIPTLCPKCQSTELIPIGAGTQRVHDYLQTCFPNYSVLRIDRDETKNKGAMAKHLDKIHQGEAKLIVGTQMLAKGHHFPKLSLVVVLDADAGFYNQDFRSQEHLGQLLTQVAGRAGRADEPGEVLIQTHIPDHPLLNVLIREGYDAFAKALLPAREKAQLPPYHFLAVIRAQSKSISTLNTWMHALKQQINHQSIQTLGPAPSPMPRKANQHRMQLLVKCHSRQLLKSTLTAISNWLIMKKNPSTVRWNIDVDPMDLS